MKILVGCFYHETNTFNPEPTTVEDFILVEGEDMLNRLGSTSEFRKNNIDIVPSIYATGLSSGIVKKETFEYFVNKIISQLKNADELDGVWLHLHGSMIVEEIGSGELALLKEIRKCMSDEVPISLTLDIHANIPQEIAELVNIVRSYRTVPHIDQLEIERVTASLLVDAIRQGEAVKPVFVSLPMTICGEKALGKSEPLRSIFKKLDTIEENEEIAAASFFLGHAWSDSIHTGASIFIVPKSREFIEAAHEASIKLKDFICKKKSEFDFAALALNPDEAIKTSLQRNNKPIFISDSGDNTTAGAPGYNTVLLRKMLNQNLKGKKVLIASILDKSAFEKLKESTIGDKVAVSVGGGYDKNSEKVHLQGVLKAKGSLLGYLNAENDVVGEVCTVSLNDLDVVVANRGDSFISINHFKKAGLNFDAYDVIVLKQGYLFDDLEKVSNLAILALTPGATYLQIKEIDYQHIRDDQELI